MPMLTFIARVTDGLLLVASMDATNTQGSVDMYRDQAKQILKKLTPQSVAKCSIDSKPVVFQ